LTLEAYLRDNPTRHTQVTMTTFANTVDEAFQLLVTAIREEHNLSTFPDVQAAFSLFKHSKKTTSHLLNEVRVDQRFVLIEARRIVNTIDAIYQLLSDRPST
jgi:hypothetical protein